MAFWNSIRQQNFHMFYVIIQLRLLSCSETGKSDAKLGPKQDQIKQVQNNNLQIVNNLQIFWFVKLLLGSHCQQVVTMLLFCQVTAKLSLTTCRQDHNRL